jgi:hypothetical protein
MGPSQAFSGASVSRARQRFLGLTSYHLRTDAQAQLPSALHLTPEVQRQLLAYFYSPGSIRSGPLFGRRQNGIRVVTAAGRGVPPGLIPEGSSELFALDAGYMLGWSDALTEGQSEIDWIGHWLIAANNAAGSYEEHLDWLHQAQSAVVLDDETFLLTLGHEEEQVIFGGWAVQARRPTTLPVTRLRSGGS